MPEKNKHSGKEKMNEAELNKKFEYWWWPNVINEDQIKEINSICKEFYNPITIDGPALDTVKTVNVKQIQWKYLKTLLSDVMDLWLQKNKEVFGYSLFPINDGDFLNVNIYDSLNQGEYDWHLDCVRDHVTDIKLTGILNISDELYEGGEFNLFCGKFMDLPEIREPGSLIILGHKVLHKVEPVTKGKRKTISYWFSGPKFI